MYYWKKIFNPKSCLPLPLAEKKNTFCDRLLSMAPSCLDNCSSLCIWLWSAAGAECSSKFCDK